MAIREKDICNCDQALQYEKALLRALNVLNSDKTLSLSPKLRLAHLTSDIRKVLEEGLRVLSCPDTKKEKKLVWVCPECGSTDVQGSCIVNLNPLEIVGDFNDDYFCENCQANIKSLDQREE